MQKLPLEIKFEHTHICNKKLHILNEEILELENKIEAVKEECELEVVKNNNM